MNERIAEKIVTQMRRLVALKLWEVEAIKINLAEPFKLVSGNYSPIYVNCRQLIASTAFADLFTAGARLLCEHHAVEFDVVAGGETAGIPYAAFVARAFGRPMIYVRKAAKSHGVSSRIEGALHPGSHVLLVEDLITDAGSKMSFVQAIRDAGAAVQDVLVVFDRLQGGKEALAQEGIRLHAVTNMDIALCEAEAAGLLSAEHLRSVREYLRPE